MIKQTPEEVTLPATQIASAVQKSNRKPGLGFRWGVRVRVGAGVRVGLGTGARLCQWSKEGSGSQVSSQEKDEGYGYRVKSWGARVRVGGSGVGLGLGVGVGVREGEGSCEQLDGRERQQEDAVDHEGGHEAGHAPRAW